MIGPLGYGRYGEDPGDWPDMLTKDQQCIIVRNDGAVLLWDGEGGFTRIDPFPSDAKPGMYAVQLRMTP